MNTELLKINQELSAKITKETNIEVEAKAYHNCVCLSIKDSHFNTDVEIRYEKEWRATELKYTVQTTSYGALEPTDTYVAAIQLQAIFLTDKTLITLIKESVMRVEALKQQIQ